MQIKHGDYLISDEPERLDVTAIHAYLSRSYWAEGIPREIVDRAVQGSLCLGIYSSESAQVGLVRIVSDYATFAYVCDVYVLEAHCRHGLAKAALRFMLAHPRLQGLRRLSLNTRDAHSLYAGLGFTPLARPGSCMEMRRTGGYVTPTISPA